MPILYIDGVGAGGKKSKEPISLFPPRVFRCLNDHGLVPESTLSLLLLLLDLFLFKKKKKELNRDVQFLKESKSIPAL